MGTSFEGRKSGLFQRYLEMATRFGTASAGGAQVEGPTSLDGVDMAAEFANAGRYAEALAGGAKPDIDGAQLAKGVEVEMEHTTSRAVAEKIARDHLTEHPAYYDALERMEAGLEDRGAVSEGAVDVDAIDFKPLSTSNAHDIADDIAIFMDKMLEFNGVPLAKITVATEDDSEINYTAPDGSKVVITVKVTQGGKRR